MWRLWMIHLTVRIPHLMRYGRRQGRMINGPEWLLGVQPAAAQMSRRGSVGHRSEAQGPALERDRRRRKRGALELVGRGRREQGTKPLMILEGQREGLLRRPVPPRVGAPPAFLLRKRQVVQLEVGACEVGDRAGRPVPGAPRLRDKDPTIADVARADLRRRGGVAARTAAALRSPGLPVSHRHDSVGPPADPTKRPARTRCTGDGRLNPHATPATPSPSRSHGTRRYRPLR